MSLCSYILVLYYTHHVINFDENAFYFNFTATFTSYIVITFSFWHNYMFTTSWLRQKTFFLLIMKLISLILLLRQDLEKLHIFTSLLLLLHSLQCDSDKKNILTSTTFIFQLNAHLLPPLPCHDQDNYFFISLLRSYIMIERKIINLVTTLLHHNLRVKKYLFSFSHYTTFTTSWLREKTFFILALRSIHHGCRKRNLIFIEPLLWLCYDH